MSGPSSSSPPPGGPISPPPGERSERWGRASEATGGSRSKLWLVSMLVVVGVVLIGVMVGPSIYRKVRRERGIRMGRTAGEMLAANDIPAAARLIRTALQWAPGDPGVSRVAARYCERVGNSEGLTYWGIVLTGPQATRADRLEAAEFALRVGRVDLSGPWLQAVFQESPHELPVLRLMLRHLQRAGNRPGALSFARLVLAEFPSEPEAEFTLGGILMGEATKEQRAEGRRLLWGLAAGTSPFRGSATEALASSPELGRSELELLARTIEARTQTTLHARFEALDLRIRLEPERKQEWVKKGLSLMSPDSEPVDFGQLVLWLDRQGAVGEALPLLDPDRCRTNAILMAARLDALMALNRTDEIERMVAVKPDALAGPLLSAARAALAVRAGHVPEAELLFREAIQSGQNNVPVLTFVAERAEAAGLPLVAIEACQHLLAIPGSTLDAARRILRLVKPLEDLTVARSTLQRLNAFIPGDENVAGERAWLEALFGEQTDWAMTTLDRLMKAHPDHLGWRFGLALATWRKGKAAAALSLIEETSPDWDKLEPRWQVVYVVVLGANQQREAARRFARRVPQDRLRLQEKTLLTDWL